MSNNQLMGVENNKQIIINVFTKRKILSVEAILSAYTHTNTHTGTRTHDHTAKILILIRLSSNQLFGVENE